MLASTYSYESGAGNNLQDAKPQELKLLKYFSKIYFFINEVGEKYSTYAFP